MLKQLDTLKLDYEFFPAVDGRRLSQQELTKLCDFKWMMRYEGRELSRGEIGCALSHIRVYQRIIKENIPYALILEDDAWLTPAIVPVLQALEKMITPTEFNVYSLSTGDGRTSRLVVSPYFLKKSSTTFCTHAYVLTRQAALRMVDVMFPVAHVSDPWGWLTKHNIIKLYTVFPQLATQNNIIFKSDIWSDGGRPQNSPKKMIEVVRHKGYRAYWKLFDVVLPLNWRK